MMDNSADSSDIVDRDGDAAATTSSSISVAGGGRIADVLLWKRHRLSFGVTGVATVAWLIFEISGLPFLSVCSDVLLLLITLIFIHANYAAYRNNIQLDTSLKLELSEEMINNAATSVRVKINYLLFLAHGISVGKDFKLIFLVFVCLWFLSAIGSYFSFFTLVYIGTLLSIIIPALYSRYEDGVDRYCGTIHKKVSQYYRVIVAKFQV